MGRRARKYTDVQIGTLKYLGSFDGGRTTRQIAAAAGIKSIGGMTRTLQALRDRGLVLGVLQPQAGVPQPEWTWSLTEAGRQEYDGLVARESGAVQVEGPVRSGNVEVEPIGKRASPLPDMSRLFKVWSLEEKSPTQLEHATHICLTFWIEVFADVKILSADDLAVEFVLPEEMADIASMIVRAIDDEVTWHLGNRLESVILLGDDVAEVATVGELISRMGMLNALLEKWPPTLGQCPLEIPFAEFAHRYEALAADLVRGSARQPRRKSHGAPPIQPPRRIELGRIPQDWPPSNLAAITESPS